MSKCELSFQIIQWIVLKSHFCDVLLNDGLIDLMHEFRNMVLALKEISIRGDFRTTVEYLVQLLEHEYFSKNIIDTGWLDYLISKQVQVSKLQGYYDQNSSYWLWPGTYSRIVVCDLVKLESSYHFCHHWENTIDWRLFLKVNIWAIISTVVKIWRHDHYS